MQHARYLVMLSAVLLAGAPVQAAANKADSKSSEPDRIDVIAHLPLSGGPVAQLTTGEHWRRNFLYVDHGPGRAVTILDVTNAAEPKAAGQMDLPPAEANGNLTAVVGTAALVASPASAPVARTVSIMNFADPEHPQVQKQFAGVTAILKDPSRGLVYLANGDGLWVLRMDPATDLKMEQEYYHDILYNH